MKLTRILTISHGVKSLIRSATTVLLAACVTATLAAPVTLNPLYDDNGNTLNIGKAYFVYSDDNRLREVRQGSNPGKIVESYIVDPITGQRIKKIINAKSVKGGGNKPKGGGGGGNPTTVYYPFQDFLTVVGSKQAGDYAYYFDGASRIAKKDNKGSYSFIHADHLGSAHVITDDTGNIIERTTHLPFGEIRIGGEEDRYSFTGKELDTTDIFDFHARSYDPFVRSFLQPDTVVPFKVDQIRMANVPGDAYRFEDSFGVNSYGYAKGNPVAFVDPDGNWFKELVTGQQSFDDFVVEVGQAANYLSENNKVWDTAISHPVAAGAVVGVVGGVAAGGVAMAAASGGAALSAAGSTLAPIAGALVSRGKNLVQATKGVLSSTKGHVVNPVSRTIAKSQEFLGPRGPVFGNSFYRGKGNAGALNHGYVRVGWSFNKKTGHLNLGIRIGKWHSDKYFNPISIKPPSL